ncbi:MAG: hypothetical protein U0869_16720 [Chloroflexota bacterium]
MSMTGDQRSSQTGQQLSMQEGDDFTCSNCGCEIRLRHHGDPARMQRMQPFTCCCGTPMQPEQGGGTQG